MDRPELEALAALELVSSNFKRLMRRHMDESTQTGTTIYVTPWSKEFDQALKSLEKAFPLVKAAAEKKRKDEESSGSVVIDAPPKRGEIEK